MEHIGRELRCTVEMIGAELTTETTVMFVDHLMNYDEQDVISTLKLCARELKGKITLKDVLDLMGVASVKDRSQADNEAAWELVLKVRKHHLRKKASGDGDECYEFCSHIRCGWELYPGVRRGDLSGLMDAHFAKNSRNEVPSTRVPCPQIPRRVEDAVFRIGDWARVARMVPEDFTWVHKDFIAQYKALQTEEQRQFPLGENCPGLREPVEKTPVEPELMVDIISRLAQGKTMGENNPARHRPRHSAAQLKEQIQELQKRRS
jgi:hypothetical protein